MIVHSVALVLSGIAMAPVSPWSFTGMQIGKVLHISMVRQAKWCVDVSPLNNVFALSGVLDTSLTL